MYIYLYISPQNIENYKKGIYIYYTFYSILLILNIRKVKKGFVFMIHGIYLKLNDFCSYCPNFEPAYKKTDAVTAIDKFPRILTEITCTNEEMCKMLREKFETEIGNSENR